jgi:Asp-tRNA(Asn)/Glu-tRNA(Gln) amidotransferase A subunit family amidase
MFAATQETANGQLISNVRVVSPVTASAATGMSLLGAREAAERMRSGTLTARDYALALLGCVDRTETHVQAWTCLDEEYLLRQADAADDARHAGAECGPLHGVPVGVKDIIDTADLPTENGTVLHAGRQPQRDAVVVSRLRAAGGLLMGKTVTTELATYAPGKTRNPRDPSRTPGGSSSGSAAAVAAGMVPLAIGTQTNGSVIRPASFCGVVGYKPTAGWIPRTGVLRQSPALDQVGVFARNVEDAALLVDSLCGWDVRDPSTAPRRKPMLLEATLAPTVRPPRFGFVRTPMWERVAPDAQAAFVELAGLLGEHVVEIELPGKGASVVNWHRTLMEAEIAKSFEAEYASGARQLSVSLRAQIERGRAVNVADYQRALEQRVLVAEAFDDLFDGIDAILTPATLGTAPLGLESTGDPVMCTLWTFTGQPAISLPKLHGTDGMPLGVQLVGRRDDDAHLLRAAGWLGRFPTVIRR